MADQHIHSTTGRRALALIPASLAFLLALSIGVALGAPDGGVAAAVAIPGRFLLASFGVVAWWAPLFFVALVFALLSARGLSWAGVALLNVLHLPAITLAVLVRLASERGTPTAPLLTALVSSFTARGAILIASLVLAVEGVLVLHIWRVLARRGRGDTGRSREWVAVDEDETELGPVDGTPGAADDEPTIPTAVSLAEEDLDRLGVGPSSRRADPDGSPALSGDLPVQEMLARLKDRLAVVEQRPAAGATDPEEDAPLPLMLRRRHAEHPPGPRAQLVATGGSPAVVAFDAEEADQPVDDPDVIVAWQDEEEDLEDGEVLVEDEDELDAPDVVRPPMARSSRSAGKRRYEIPVGGILREYSDGRYWEIDDTTRDAAEVLRVTLEEFGIKAEVTGIRKGPVITMFEILPAPGVKLAKITNLADNIALRLAAASVRIVAPIPGKHAVGIEIPNRERNIVSFAELLQADEFFDERSEIPIALGKDIAGEAQIVDLTRMPHLLIGGATGSGKSVCVNSIICSVLYRRSPNEVKLILIDPKIVELKFYNHIPHLLTPVITDPKKAFQALQYLIYEMERRYSLLDSVGARDIAGFNARIKRKNLASEPLPYIVVVIDEFADLMATSGKELESTVARIAAMSRAVGIHLVLATQRPSTDVITGLIKANIPARIAFMVANKVDSRIIIDANGADKLLGRGDMLFTSAADPFPVRIQGAFLSEDEVEKVVVEVKQYGEPDYIDDEIFIEEDEEELGDDYLEDPLMEKAIEVVNTSRKASASYLQRRLKVGYNRAARMVEQMERMGIVGPQNGSRPREVLGGSGDAGGGYE